MGRGVWRGEGKNRVDLSTLRWGSLSVGRRLGSEEGGGLPSFVVDVINGRLTRGHWGLSCPVGSDLDM